MAKRNILVCDVTNAEDESVATQNPTFSLPVFDDNGVFTGEFKVVVLTLDIATETFGKILSDVQEAITPLMTSNTTVKVKGERKPKDDAENADSDKPSEDLVVDSPQHMRAWGELNGLVEEGKRGALPKKVKEAYATSAKRLDIKQSDITE